MQQLVLTAAHTLRHFKSCTHIVVAVASYLQSIHDTVCVSVSASANTRLTKDLCHLAYDKMLRHAEAALVSMLPSGWMWGTHPNWGVPPSVKPPTPAGCQRQELARLQTGQRRANVKVASR